jgi:hypothetical protein
MPVGMILASMNRDNMNKHQQEPAPVCPDFRKLGAAAGAGPPADPAPPPPRAGRTVLAQSEVIIDSNHKKCETGSQHMNTTPSIKDYLRKIGSKGGKKSAQHPDRPRLNKEAAIARWRSRIPVPKHPEK